MNIIKKVIAVGLMLWSYFLTLAIYVLPVNKFEGKGEGLPYVVDADSVLACEIYAIFAIILCMGSCFLLKKKRFLIFLLLSVILNMNRYWYLASITDKVNQGILMGR